MWSGQKELSPKLKHIMNALLLKPADLKLLPDVAKPFSVFAAFDDSLARRKAIQIYSRLVEQFAADFDFDCGWWSFDQLNQTYIAEEAARVAAQADLVIIAAAGSEDLPSHIKLWIEMWLAKKGVQETALVVTIGVTTRQEHPMTAAHAYLAKVAHQVGLDYFPAQFQLPKPMPCCTIEAILARAETVTPLLERILHWPPPPRGGINE